MVAFERRDLVCLYLDARVDAVEQSPASPAVTAAGIGDALDLGDTPARRIRLLEDLASLREEGLVVAEECSIDGYDDPRTVYRPTDAGREHARDIRERLETATVVVTNGATEEVALADVGHHLEGAEAPLVRALVRLTDDDELVLDRPDGERFVDREDALATVVDAVEGSFRRESRTVVVGGAAGMGKTALVERAVEEASGTHADLVYARGSAPSGAADPYAAFRRAFEAIPDGGALLDRLSAARATTTPDTPEALQAQRAALFDDLADRLREAATDRPIVVAVENLQSADEATLELFAHLATAVDEWVYPVAFVGTYRPAAVAGGDHPLPAVIERVGAAGHCRELLLEPLEREDTRTLLAGLVGTHGLPDAFVEVVHDRTGGNPLFVRETATHLLESGEVAPDAGTYPTSAAELSLPREVVDQVDRRLVTLDDESRELVRVGALLGERVPGQVLAEAVDIDAPRRREYVDLLVASRIWTPASGSPAADAGPGVAGGPTTDAAGDFQFVGGAVREAVLERLRPEEAAEYHARVADALTTVYLDESDRQAARVAHHYREAGEHAAAVEYYRRAGDHARATYANEEALAHYRTALSIGEQTGAVDEATLVELADEVRSIHEATGDFEAAMAVVEEWLDRVEPDSPERCRLLGRKANVERKQGTLEDSLSTARRQLELARELGDPEREARARNFLGEAFLFRNEYERASDHLEGALGRLDGSEAPRLAAGVHINLGNIAFRRGDHEDAREEYETARDHLDPDDHPETLALVDMNLGNIPSQRGRYGVARAQYRSALDRFEAIGDRHGAALTRANLALAGINQGAYDDAQEQLERALSVLEAAGDRQRVALARLFLARVARNRGDVDAAADHLDEATENVEESGSRRRVAEVELERARLALARGDHAGASESAETALSDLAAVEDELGVAKARLVSGRVALARGDHGDARERATAASETFERLDAAHWLGRARRLQGRVAAATDGDDGAREQFRAGLDALEDVEAPRDGLATLRELVERCRQVGDDEDAAEWCRRARAVLEEAPPGTTEQHREWVRRQAAALDVG
jgi:tetratricopeptide (TPR) repeat protein